VIDLADNYVKLSASAKETNLEGEATRKIFEATASTMAVLGGDTITTERAFRALGQIMSKGQVYAEELKGQLAEAIPGALQIMSRALGISTNEMLRLMEARQLSADVLLPFATQLEKEYGNLASSSTTFTQAINRIQTEWTLLMKRLGDTGAFNLLSKTMEFVGNNASVMAGAIGSLATVGLVMLGKGLVSVVGGLNAYISATRFAANATQQSAVATLAKAEADAQAALAARTSSQSALLSAQANEVSTRGTQLHALAVRELALAQAQATIASNNYIAATKSIQVAQTALIASQGLLSKAWAFITGPAGLIALTIAGFASMTYAFRGQDDATKTLSKSTEEYTQDLEKLTAAQINLVNARAKEQAADDQSRINTIKEELEFLYKKIDAEKQGIEVNREKSISWYGFKNVLSNLLSTEDQLAQAQADLDEATNNLTITEAKRSIGIGALANQYLLLQKTTQEQQASLNAVNQDWLEQNKIVDASKQTYIDLVNLTGAYSNQSIEAHKNVGQAVEGLQLIEQKRNDQLLLNKNIQTQVNTAIQAYAEELGVSVDAVRVGISGDQQAIDKLDAKSKAIALSVQNLLRLTDEEKALAAQV
ncbi:MAG: tape measure protein, partial [Streptococcus sp.]|nr:tape measure protein [Streptococcus sp.]